MQQSQPHGQPQSKFSVYSELREVEEADAAAEVNLRDAVCSATEC